MNMLPPLMSTMSSGQRDAALTGGAALDGAAALEAAIAVAGSGEGDGAPLKKKNAPAASATAPSPPPTKSARDGARGSRTLDTGFAEDVSPSGVEYCVAASPAGGELRVDDAVIAGTTGGELAPRAGVLAIA